MAIREKGKGFQVDVTVNGIRAPRVSVETYVEAQRIEADFKASLLRGVVPEKPSQETKAVTFKNTAETLGQLADYAMRHHWAGTKSERTAEINAYAWVNELGRDFRVNSLTLEGIDEVTARWGGQGLKPATINRKIAALSVMLKIARDRGWLGHDIPLKQKPEYNGRIRWYSADELASQQVFFADDPDFLDLITVAVDTGFRYGELIGTLGRDYRPGTNRYFTWVNKGDDPRSVPLTDRAREIILRRRQDIQDWERLFPTTLTKGAISRRLKAWRQWSKLPEDDDGCFHTFRHTCASRLVEAGVSLPVVKEWMGHANIETTMKYVHLAPDAFDKALAALN